MHHHELEWKDWFAVFKVKVILKASYGQTMTLYFVLWWGCCGLCHFYSVLVSVSVCMAPQLTAFSLLSSGLISALLVLSTIYLFMKTSLSPDIILCGWLGLQHQLTKILNCWSFATKFCLTTWAGLSLEKNRLFFVFKGRVTAENQTFNDCSCEWYLLNCWNFHNQTGVVTQHHAVWWFSIMGQSVIWKDWFAIFKVKVTVRAHITNIWLLLPHLLNYWSSCNQI